MQRDVELSGGPLAGSHWPARLDADQTLWIGIGADGGEYDGRSRLKAIAIYERAGSDDSPRFDFARLEGPGARIAELGRRITRLRANWVAQRRAVAETSDSRDRLATIPIAPAPPPVSQAVDTAQIAGRVFERWLRAVESLPPASSDGKVRISLIVPGEAEQFCDLLERHGVAVELFRSTVEVRLSDSDEPQTLETGAVEIQVSDAPVIAELLREIVSRA